MVTPGMLFRKFAGRDVEIAFGNTDYQQKIKRSYDFCHKPSLLIRTLVKIARQEKMIKRYLLLLTGRLFPIFDFTCHDLYVAAPVFYVA